MAPAAGSFQTPPPPVILSMAESGSTTAANPFTHGKLSDAHPGSISPLHGGSLLDPDYAANYLFSLEDTEGVGDVCHVLYIQS
jgi:hypothetical protein